MSAYAELKARHCQDLFARLPEMIAHIGWSQAQLRVERHRLRELITRGAAVALAPRPTIRSDRHGHRTRWQVSRL